MGLNEKRFQEKVNEELYCSVCQEVLQDPVQAPECEHLYCKICIEDWLKVNATCSEDRKKLSKNDLKMGPRVIKNMLDKLLLTCQFSGQGCTAVLRLDGLKEHGEICSKNPDVDCQSGLKEGSLASKKSVQDLRNYVDEIKSSHEQEIKKLREERQQEVANHLTYVNQLEQRHLDQQKAIQKLSDDKTSQQTEINTLRRLYISLSHEIVCDNDEDDYDDNEGDDNDEGVNLYVNNLDDDLDEDMLRDEFSEYGNVLSTKVMYNNAGEPKGFGFVCLSSLDEAIDAIERMNGAILSYNAIQVSIAHRRGDGTPQIININ